MGLDYGCQVGDKVISKRDHAKEDVSNGKTKSYEKSECVPSQPFGHVM